ncbi:hypothetical protein CMUST_01080 [Corynebacterium mustelae]|uniref:Uncharacterized protein n=1 Tax=Corynebacterium mustelae TaxID=571915 RepID=A0A0G3GTR5_9CORY|nr:hypothetical protein CMUST_01080 [Corynebacterium mustelae]
MSRIVRLRMNPGLLAELGVVPFVEDRLSVVAVKVKDTVSVPSITLEDIHVLMSLIARKALGNLGVGGVSESQVDLIFRVDPQVKRFRRFGNILGTKVQRNVGLFSISSGLGNPGESPVRHLVLVTVDVQKESFFKHATRIIRLQRETHSRSAEPLSPTAA